MMNAESPLAACQSVVPSVPKAASEPTAGGMIEIPSALSLRAHQQQQPIFGEPVFTSASHECSTARKEGLSTLSSLSARRSSNALRSLSLSPFSTIQTVEGTTATAAPVSSFTLTFPCAGKPSTISRGFSQFATMVEPVIKAEHEWEPASIGGPAPVAPPLMGELGGSTENSTQVSLKSRISCLFLLQADIYLVDTQVNQPEHAVVQQGSVLFRGTRH